MTWTTPFDGQIGRSWRYLAQVGLPAAAQRLGWPVATAAGLERIVLDHVLGKPWEAVIEGPSHEGLELLDLVFAIETAERLIDGTLDVARLDRRSRAMRGCGCCGIAPLQGAPDPPVDGMTAEEIVARIRAHKRSGGRRSARRDED